MTRPSATAVLWAVCERFPEPQLVAAWSESLRTAFPEEFDRLRYETERWFMDFGDEDHDWRFWVETHMITPALTASLEGTQP